MKITLKKKESRPETPEVKEAPDEVLSLPKTLSEPCENLGGYVSLIYGEKKIGKTSLTSHFGKTFHMMCEAGGKALRIFQRPVRNWKEFKNYNRLICKDKEFASVTIDTADRAYQMCFKHKCAEMGIEHPSDEQWGKGWNAIKEEFVNEIDLLLKCGKGVFFISHAREESIKKRSGDEFSRIIPTLPAAAREILEGLVDIWAYYCYEDGKRVLYVQGDDFIGAGHRIEKHFKYTDGTPIQKIDMGKNSREAYENFMAAFENRLKGGPAQTEKPTKKFVIRKSK